MRKLLASLFVVAAVGEMGFAVSGPVTMMNETGLAYSTTPVQNLQQYGSPQGVATKLSAQVTFGSATIASQTFTDGIASTGSLTVVSTAPLVAASATDSITVPSTAAILGSPATNQITVVSTTGLAGLNASFTTVLANYTGIALSSPSLIINAQETYTYAGNWGSTDTIAHAATTLATAINANSTVYRAAVVSSTGVTITLISSGTFANVYTVNSSSLSDISTGTFRSGADPVVISINNGNQVLKYTYNDNWASSGTTTTSNAASLAAAIANTGPSDGVTATSASNVVYASAAVVGTASNSFTITTSSASRVSVSSSSFLGGTNPALLTAYFSVNGSNYRNGYHWTDASGTSTGTAASIATYINSISTYSATPGQGLGNIRASAVGGVITLVTVSSGALNNGITLAATPSSGGFTIGSANFTGGQDNASITINGTTLTLGTDIPPLTISSTTSNLATAIATAINANAILAPLITAQATGAVVVSTADTVGAVTNYTTVSSTQSKLSFANATMTGGANVGYNITTDLITISSHGFTKALPVLYSGSPAIGGLSTGTTYFVVVVDANNIGLSSTSVVALAGNYINLTSSTTGTTTHTYTLAPGPFIQGPASGKWQVSNDGTNWNDYTVTSNNVSVSSQTYVAVNPSTTTVQDFGAIDYGYLRYNVLGPTQGGVTLKVILNAKD